MLRLKEHEHEDVVSAVTTTEDSALKDKAKQIRQLLEETAISPVKKALLDAANLLEIRGWVRGMFVCREGFCIHGALGYVTAGHGSSRYDGSSTQFGPIEQQAINAVADLIYGKGSGNIEHYILAPWNDKPVRTKEEVVTALRMAAELVS